MAVKYFLIKSALKGAADKWVARLKKKDIVSFESVIREAAAKGRIYREEQIKASVELIMDVIKEQLKMGNPVKTPWGTFSHSISGTFNNFDDLFDYHHNNVNITFSLSNEIKAVEKDIKATKINAGHLRPSVSRVIDYDSGQTNKTITPGGVIEIHGSLLKLTGPQSSLSFRDSKHKEWVCSLVHVNTKSKIIAKVPDLPGGEYQILVRTHYNGSGNTVKEVRTGIDSRQLTVDSAQ